MISLSVIGMILIYAIVIWVLFFGSLYDNFRRSVCYTAITLVLSTLALGVYVIIAALPGASGIDYAGVFLLAVNFIVRGLLLYFSLKEKRTK